MWKTRKTQVKWRCFFRILFRKTASPVGEQSKNLKIQEFAIWDFQKGSKTIGFCKVFGRYSKAKSHKMKVQIQAVMFSDRKRVWHCIGHWRFSEGSSKLYYKKSSTVPFPDFLRLERLWFYLLLASFQVRTKPATQIHSAFFFSIAGLAVFRNKIRKKCRHFTCVFLVFHTAEKWCLRCFL